MSGEGSAENVEGRVSGMPGMRALAPAWDLAAQALGVGMAAFYMYSGGWGVAAPQYHLGLYTLFTFLLVLLLMPARRGAPARRPSGVDLALAGLSLLSVGYWIWEYQELAYRAGAYTRVDFWMGVVGILLSLEVARRGLGWIIPILSILFLAFAYFGPYFPAVIAHRGSTVRQIVEWIYLSDEGTFGVMTNAMATFVILYIYFSALMNRSGVGRFFIELPLAVAGRTAGGPAKVAVVSSAIFGTISGSSLANTVATGAFTIPMMKRIGFRPHVAGAVEAAADLGGQLMPPVMGAGAFIMAEIINRPYADIAAAAAIPATLFFLSVFIMVHLEAKKYGIKGMRPEEVPRFWAVLKGGWFHVVPLGVLLYLLFVGYSAAWAACWAMASIVAINWARVALAWALPRWAPPVPEEEVLGPRGIWEALVEGSRSTVVAGCVAAAIGIIVGVVTLTGLGLKFSYILVALSGGSKLAAVLLVGLASLVLGMGLPITAAYLVLAVLAGPALGEFGIPLLAAHLIVFWYSQDSNITPPVCLGAYVAAAIAQADPFKTGLAAFKFAKHLYVMPILFAYTPILFTGTWEENLSAIFSATLGTIVFSIWTMFHFLRPMTIPEWVALGVSSFLCFWPGLPTTAAGLALFALVYLSQRRKVREEVALGAPARVRAP